MNSRKKSKKFILLLITIAFLCLFIKHRITLYKSKELTFAVEHYFTSSILMNPKLYNIYSLYVKFSDGNIAVIEVYGLENKPPHRQVKYKVFAEKSYAGYWKIKKSVIMS